MQSDVATRAPKILPLTPVARAAEIDVRGAHPAKPLHVRGAGRVIIEIVGICQAKCPYCAQNSGKSRRQDKPAAYMPVELFRRIIDHLADSGSFGPGKLDRVYLYNWGEPFLAPAINEYLEVLKGHGLFAAISSNFQKVPVIREENLPVINEVLFSTSGMTQDTYGRIHGGVIEKVLANFEAFHARMKRHAPKSRLFMAWHRYTFNEHEFWKAYSYARRAGIGFIPSVAFLNDLTELIQATTDKMPADRRENAQRDLFFTHMVNSIRQYTEGASAYDCPAWDDVVVDEQGRLLLCCGTDSQTAVGPVFDYSFEEMRDKKIRTGLCRVCKDTGVAEWAHNNYHERNQLPWPSGGGLEYARLKLNYGKLRLRSDIRHVLNITPFGDRILDAYRKFKHA